MYTLRRHEHLQTLHTVWNKQINNYILLLHIFMKGQKNAPYLNEWDSNEVIEHTEPNHFKILKWSSTFLATTF